MHLIVAVIYIFLTVSNIVHSFMCLLTIWLSSLGKCLLSTSAMYCTHITTCQTTHTVILSERNEETSWMTPAHGETKDVSTLKPVEKAETDSHHKPHPGTMPYNIVRGKPKSQLLPRIHVFLKASVRKNKESESLRCFFCFVLFLSSCLLSDSSLFENNRQIKLNRSKT